jgi:SHS2 domain-containing protein
LQARAAGEPINPAKHALGADVKGVTLHRLQVVPTPAGWEATVVLDV